MRDFLLSEGFKSSAVATQFERAKVAVHDNDRPHVEWDEWDFESNQRSEVGGGNADHEREENRKNKAVQDQRLIADQLFDHTQFERD